MDGTLCLAYKCEGAVRHNAIAIVVNGFAATSDSYYFVGMHLQRFTRTCTFDPRGQGWSQWPNRHFIGDTPDFGFGADAADVQTILDAEFDLADVGGADRVAVLAGHSRGRLVAVKFQAQVTSHSDCEADYEVDSEGDCLVIASSA